MTVRRDFLKRAVATILLQPVAGAAQAMDRAPHRSGTVQSVLGPLGASRLGFTLAHEHIADAPDILDRWAGGGRDELVGRAVALLKGIKAAGVETVVDLTTYDVARDIRFLQAVSRGSGLTMIAATGQRFFPPQSARVAMPSRTVEGLAEFFQGEIEQGIDGTAVKAGVIKIGVVAQHASALEEVGLRAGARASRKTGVPMRIHAKAADRAGEGIALILEDEGIDPARVSFDHSDDSGRMDYFLGLARRGYCLGMDHVHRGLDAAFTPSFERRVECIRQLADAGFAGNIFLSQDAEFGGALLPPEKREWRETIDPAQGMLFVPLTLIPRLLQIGVSQDAVHAMTVRNPRRFFSLA